MTSEEIYRYKTRPTSNALKALQLQAEEHWSEFAPVEGSPRARSARRKAFASDNKEYKAKRAIRGLEPVFEADEEEF